MYNLKVIHSGKRLEVYKYNGYTVGNKGENVLGEVFQDNNKRRLGNEELDQDEKENNQERSRATNLNNARNNIIRLIKANEDMETFITLTFKEESNYKDSKKLLNNFFTKLRRDYQGLKYLWVLEYGSFKGRLHYHVLTNIPIDIKLSSSKENKSQGHKTLENTFRVKYWVHGWVDIRHLGQEDNTNIALYVAAYITKDMIGKQLEGYRIYGYSNKTLIKPIVTTEYTTESLETVIEGFKGAYMINHTNSYEIGYTTTTGNYKGTVLYLDLIKKEE